MSLVSKARGGGPSDADLAAAWSVDRFSHAAAAAAAADIGGLQILQSMVHCRPPCQLEELLFMVFVV